MDVFTQKEKDVLQKEYLAKNIDKTFNQLSKLYPDFNDIANLQFVPQETEVIYTEHNHDTKTNMGTFLKNASTKSIISAPFSRIFTGAPALMRPQGSPPRHYW